MVRRSTNPLIVLDGSTRSDAAIRQIQEVLGENAKATLLFSCPHFFMARAAYAYFSADTMLIEDLDNFAHDYLRRALCDIPRDLVVATQITRERPRTATLKAIRRDFYDLVVVATKRNLLLSRQVGVPVHRIRGPYAALWARDDGRAVPK